MSCPVQIHGTPDSRLGGNGCLQTNVKYHYVGDAGVDAFPDTLPEGGPWQAWGIKSDSLNKLDIQPCHQVNIYPGYKHTGTPIVYQNNDPNQPKTFQYTGGEASGIYVEKIAGCGTAPASANFGQANLPLNVAPSNSNPNGVSAVNSMTNQAPAQQPTEIVLKSQLSIPQLAIQNRQALLYLDKQVSDLNKELRNTRRVVEQLATEIKNQSYQHQIDRLKMQFNYNNNSCGKKNDSCSCNN